MKTKTENKSIFLIYQSYHFLPVADFLILDLNKLASMWCGLMRLILFLQNCMGHGMTAWRRSINPKSEEAKIMDTRAIQNISSPEILKASFS